MVENITASNQWYRTYPKALWYNDNMGITYEYLKTHMAPDLWIKVNEEYNSFPSESKGGPLLLYLMIHQLIAANESIASTLSDKIDSVKIPSTQVKMLGRRSRIFGPIFTVSKTGAVVTFRKTKLISFPWIFQKVFTRFFKPAPVQNLTVSFKISLIWNIPSPFFLDI
jgi:hypothetical protein